ncbi:MAG: hypothetical protein IKR74_04140 [Bacilli bacterium]|nr:hypothetical protein [Bacilli bacterium]
MRKITIKFMGMGACPKCQAKVTIYNLNGQKIASGYTKCGIFVFCGKDKDFYKIVFTINGITNCRTIYANSNYYPIMYQSIIFSRRVTFLLTDQFYANLPINKGEMILWQK